MITYGQLLAAGLTQAGVQRRVRAARLHRAYRGVYAWGHAGLSNEGRWIAAVLACGEGGCLSDRSSSLTNADRTRISGIEVTTSARTIADPAAGRQ